MSDLLQLLAAPHFGDFLLNVISWSSVGTRLDGTSMRIAVSLCLGVSVALWSTALVFRASLVASPLVVINNTTPSTSSSELWRQPMSRQCWSQTHGPKTMENVLLPWANGRCMVWDFTCPHALATSHLNRSVLFAGAAVNEAESRKVMKYRSPLALYSFVPVTVESLGTLGEEASDNLRPGSCLWQLSRGHSSSWCSGWVSPCNVATPRVCWELFRLQSDWTNCYIYNFNCC